MPKVTDPSLLQQLQGGQSQQPGTITIGRPNLRKEAREDASLGIQQGQLGVAQGNLAVRQATLPSEMAKTEADARTAQIEADAKAKEAAAEALKKRTALIQQSLKTSSLLSALNTARQQIGKGWSTGNMAGAKGFQGLWGVGQNSTNLAATLDGLKGSILTDTLAEMKSQSPTGASGMGSLTEKEGERLAASIGALQQEQDADSLMLNLAKVEKHYRNMFALSQGDDPRRPEVAARYGIISDEDRAEAAKANGGKVTAAGNEGVDPAMIGANNAVKRMVRNGASAQEVRDYLNAVKPGIGDAVQGLEETINYNRQNPDKPVGVDIEKQWTPTGGVAGALGEVGMSPWGSGVIGAADMLTGGTLDNMTANPDLTRATMSGVQEENPWSYLAGQVGGGAAAGLGLEAGLGRAGLSGLNAIRGGEAGYGALYGAGSADEPDDSRIASALLGAGAGLAGGALGRGAARGVGRAVTGVTDPVRQRLNQAGVSMTPGQILGGGIQRTEDRLAGLPFVGDQIQARRVEGMQDFNRAAFDEALAPIGQNTGGVIQEPGIDIARILRSSAYDDALGGVNVSADAPFVTDMQGVVSQGQRLPGQMAENAEYTLRERVGAPLGDSGGFTGRDYQQMLRGLRRDANSLEQQPYGYDFAEVTRGAEGALEGVLDRQAPGVTDALRTANEVNRNVETLRSAVNASRNGTRSGTVGVFSPSQLSDAAAASAKKYGNSQGTTNQPFYGLTRAGQEVLPSSVPDSGTAGRMAIPLIAGALAGGGGAVAGDGTEEKVGYGATGTVIGALLASAPYSAAARNTLQRVLLAERPAAFQQAGNMMINNDTIAGLLASPALLSYTGGQ